MNAARRKQLEKAAELVAEATDIIEGVRDEEQEAFDNLPQSLQDGERGSAMQEAIDALENAVSSLGEVEGYCQDASQ